MYMSRIVINVLRICASSWSLAKVMKCTHNIILVRSPRYCLRIFDWCTRISDVLTPTGLLQVGRTSTYLTYTTRSQSAYGSKGYFATTVVPSWTKSYWINLSTSREEGHLQVKILLNLLMKDWKQVRKYVNFRRWMHGQWRYFGRTARYYNMFSRRQWRQERQAVSRKLMSSAFLPHGFLVQQIYFAVTDVISFPQRKSRILLFCCCCTVHCNNITQYKPTKCTFSKQILV